MKKTMFYLMTLVAVLCAACESKVENECDHPVVHDTITINGIPDSLQWFLNDPACKEHYDRMVWDFETNKTYIGDTESYTYDVLIVSYGRNTVFLNSCYPDGFPFSVVAFHGIKISEEYVDTTAYPYYDTKYIEKGARYLNVNTGDEVRDDVDATNSQPRPINPNIYTGDQYIYDVIYFDR